MCNESTNSLAIWTTEKNGYQGYKAAIAKQSAQGGWVFLSESMPGYVVWLDAVFKPSEIIIHSSTKGHSGVLNPQKLFDRDTFLEYFTTHGLGEPNEDAYLLGEILVLTGDDYATAAFEAIARELVLETEE